MHTYYRGRETRSRTNLNAFLFVHFTIRRVEHYVKRVPIVPFRNADSQAESEFFKVTGLVPIVQLVVDPLTYLLCSRGSGIRQKDQELISTVTYNCVRAPD